MSAKPLLLFVAALALCACERLGLARFAPPGTVKYENLAKGEPVDPLIAERIAARRAERSPQYPNLSAAPQTPPEGIDDAARIDAIDALKARRDALSAEIAEARAVAEAERADFDARLSNPPE